MSARVKRGIERDRIDIEFRSIVGYLITERDTTGDVTPDVFSPRMNLFLARNHFDAPLAVRCRALAAKEGCPIDR